MKKFVSIPLRFISGIKFLDADIWEEDGIPLFVRIRFPKEAEGAIVLNRDMAEALGNGLLSLSKELKR